MQQLGLDGPGIAFVIPPLAVSNCGGQVLIENLRVAPSTSTSDFGLRITGSAHVTVTRCEFRFFAIYSNKSTLLMTDSQAIGSDAVAVHGLFAPHAGVLVNEGELVVSRCRLIGGNTKQATPPLDAAPGISMSNARVTVTGDGTGLVQAGGGPTRAVPAIAGTGTLFLNPTVRLVPAVGGSTVDTRITTQLQPIPSLRAIGAPSGGTVKIDLASASGDTFMLFLGQRGSRSALPGVPNIWLDLNRFLITVAVGVQGPTGRFPLSITAPPNIPLLSQTFTWQGLSGTPARGFFLSNPATYVHD